jgi:hypothetical protein
MTSKDLMIMAVIIIGGLVAWLALNVEGQLRFRRRPLLTGCELEFFFRLQRALPGCVVCPQIAVSALIEPLGVGKTRRAAMARIEAQRVGYAVFDEDMQLVAVVELDQRARPKRKEVARDAWFSGAGIRTVRFHAKKLPSDSRILATVFPRGEPYLESSGPRQERARADAIEFRRASTPWRDTVDMNA